MLPGASRLPRSFSLPRPDTGRAAGAVEPRKAIAAARTASGSAGPGTGRGAAEPPSLPFSPAASRGVPVAVPVPIPLPSLFSFSACSWPGPRDPPSLQRGRTWSCSIENNLLKSQLYMGGRQRQRGPGPARPGSAQPSGRPGPLDQAAALPMARTEGQAAVCTEFTRNK